MEDKRVDELARGLDNIQKQLSEVMTTRFNELQSAIQTFGRAQQQDHDALVRLQALTEMTNGEIRELRLTYVARIEKNEENLRLQQQQIATLMGAEKLREALFTTQEEFSKQNEASVQAQLKDILVRLKGLEMIRWKAAGAITLVTGSLAIVTELLLRLVLGK